MEKQGYLKQNVSVDHFEKFYTKWYTQKHLKNVGCI
jgi:hypothetical protein